MSIVTDLFIHAGASRRTCGTCGYDPFSTTSGRLASTVAFPGAVGGAAADGFDAEGFEIGGADGEGVAATGAAAGNVAGTGAAGDGAGGADGAGGVTTDPTPDPRPS